MKYLINIILSVLFFTIILNDAYAQSAMPNVSGEYREMPIEQILLSLENQSGYRFYYDTAQLDTAKIEIITFSNISLTQALDNLFKDSNMGYAIDDKKNVYISKGLIVQTKLPDSFFSTSTDSIEQEGVQHIDYADFIKTDQKNKLYTIGRRTDAVKDKYIINGYIKDSKTGEPVIGAYVNIAGSNISTTADQFGYFTIISPRGKQNLNIQSIGMEDTQLQLQVNNDGGININMNSEVMSLKDVVVSAQIVSNVRSTQLGVQKLDIKTMKQVPVVFGETDVLRVMMMMPGVKSVGEASTGLNVRGGSADQNLILFNDANIYNPSHFFGMFSAFNPEIVKDVELFKSSVPARYGGRLSSVININSREGNKKEYTGSAGIGLLTTRFNIEGPLIKDKTSFILGGRTTYANWLLKQLPNEYKNSKASFYDANLILNHEFSKKDVLYATGYISNDRFNLNSDTFYFYSNKNASLKWKHIFNNKLTATFTGGYDNYTYNISSEANPVNAYKLSFGIEQVYFKTNFNYFINSRHNLEFGINSNLHKINPGNYLPNGEESLVSPVNMQQERALESAVYLSEKFTVNPDLTIDAGLRYSLYNYLGPNTINNYPPGANKIVDNIINTTTYGKNEVINTYHGPEIRISARQMLSASTSIKAGYNTMRQYIHMLSNTTAMAPTDIWKLSDPNITPQTGDQFSLGLFQNLKSNTIELSVEGYYKRIKDYLDFKSGAVLVLNPHIETDVLKTRGKAYGVEFLAKKLTGKLNGWLGYTYSKILLKADDIESGNYINNGNFYPANYDKPHDVVLVGNYRWSHRFSTSLNANYSTGRPITLPIGRFYYEGSYRTLYGDRNAHRIPDYFRMDFSMNIEGNHKVHQKTHNSWTIGVYNITGRKNPFSVYYVSEGGVINGYKLSIFGNAIPYINFNIRF